MNQIVILQLDFYFKIKIEVERIMASSHDLYRVFQLFPYMLTFRNIIWNLRLLGDIGSERILRAMTAWLLRLQGTTDLKRCT